MAKYVVTGATGFLGANLVRALLAHGHQVECIIRKPNLLVEGLAVGLHAIPLMDQSKEVNDLAAVMEGADVDASPASKHDRHAAALTAIPPSAPRITDDADLVLSRRM